MKSKLSFGVLLLFGAFLGSGAIEALRSSPAQAQVETMPSPKNAERIRSYTIEGVGNDASVIIPQVEGDKGFIVTDIGFAGKDVSFDYPIAFRITCNNGPIGTFAASDGHIWEARVVSLKSGIPLVAGDTVSVDPDVQSSDFPWTVTICGYTY